MRRCTAASARSGYLKLSVTSGSSLCALATAASMIFQKSDGPFTTNAISGLSCAKAKVDIATDAAKARPNRYAVFMLILPVPRPPALRSSVSGTGGYSTDN